MANISKSQAEAIADGFVDSVGEGDSKTLQPRETYSEIILLAGDLIESAQQNLNKSNSNASGKLSASFMTNEPVKENNILRVDVTMNFYGRFINKGVKGVKSGSGPYSFKYDHPSKKMVDAIEEWQKDGKSKISNTNTKKTISKNEKKNASISAISSAYAIAQSIVNKGIKKTGFLDKAVLTTKDKVSDRLGAALKIDVLNSIT
jgi:hypothetical protein